MANSSTRKQKSARNPGHRPRDRSPRRRRWLVLPLALGIGAAAFYVLITAGGPGSDRPLDDIDTASRQSLERVLRDADRAEGAAR
jgi:ferric-dicitrate binding protein FerR (iron transport regulator)